MCLGKIARSQDRMPMTDQATMPMDDAVALSSCLRTGCLDEASDCANGEYGRAGRERRA